MDIQWQTLVPSLISSASLLCLYLVFFCLANFTYRFMVSYSVKDEICEKDNYAVAFTLAGYLIAISLVYIGSVQGPSYGWWQDLAQISFYSVLAMVLLYVSHWVNDKLILRHFCNHKELIEDQNIGTGIIQASSYISSGLIIAAAVQGEGGGWYSAVVFFLIGQVFLILMAYIYDAITAFDLHQEVEQGSVAVATAFAGSLIALGLILAKAASGDFISWQANLTQFFMIAIGACFVLPFFRFIVAKTVFFGVDLNHEIETDKNVGSAVLECATVIGFACVLTAVV